MGAQAVGTRHAGSDPRCDAHLGCPFHLPLAGKTGWVAVIPPSSRPRPSGGAAILRRGLAMLDAATVGWMRSMGEAIDAAFDVDDPALADDPA